MAASKVLEEWGGLDDYMNEINDIAQNKRRSSTDVIEEVVKPLEEGEMEASWLEEVGFGEAAEAFKRGHEIPGELVEIAMATFTKAQAAAVKKRVDSLNNTTRRRKQKQQAKPDMREIFSKPVITDPPPLQPPPFDTRQQSLTEDISLNKRAASKSKEISMRRTKGVYSMAGDPRKSESEVEPIRIQRLSFNDLSSPEVIAPPAAFADNCTPSSASLENCATKVKNGVDKNFTPGDLPVYYWTNDPIGITRMDELTSSDRKYVRQVVLMELTGLLDQYGIEIGRPPKVKNKIRDHGIFGVPLQTLLEYDQKKYSAPVIKVPVFVQQLLSHLEKTAVVEEGILRVPGSAYRIKSLREEIEHQFNSGKWTWGDVRPNDAAGLLKQFLRDLPYPLLTWEYMDTFCKLQSVTDQKQQLNCLNYLCLLLPDVCGYTLQLLLRFLKKVVEDKNNKMTISNVAMIMAPNLFVLPNGQMKAVDISEFTLAANTASIMRLMIHYKDLLWTIPGAILVQTRLKIEAEGQKKRLILTKKSKDKKLFNNELQQLDSAMIKVHTLKMSKKEGIDVRITTSTTAGDVVSIMLKSHAGGSYVKNGQRMHGSVDELSVAHPSSIPPMMASGGKLHLFECGGNIGERCLPNDANVLAVYKLNRSAEWLVKWRYSFEYT